MSTRRRFWAVAGGVVSLLLALNTDCRAENWRFPLQLTYVSGFQDVVDYYEKRLGIDSGTTIPVGMSFSPNAEFDYGGFAGVQVGPIEFIHTSGGNSRNFVNFPVVCTYGQMFIPKDSLSPYLRGGVSYNIVSSDDIDSSSPGLFVAAGLELSRDKTIAWGFEVAYDGATVKFVNGDKIKPVNIAVIAKVIF